MPLSSVMRKDDEAIHLLDKETHYSLFIFGGRICVLRFRQEHLPAFLPKPHEARWIWIHLLTAARALNRWAMSEIEMRRKKIFPMTLSELELLSTKQLLTRLKHLRQCEDSLDASDQDGGERTSDGSIKFKDDPEWTAEYNRLKTVLAYREHIPKGVALVEMRREKARRGKPSDRRGGKRQPGRPH